MTFVYVAGQLPALEDDQGLRLPFMENENDEFEAARHVINALKKHKDLDVALDSTQKAQGAAFLALIRLYLEPASIWTSWGENVSFNQHLKVTFLTSNHRRCLPPPTFCP